MSTIANTVDYAIYVYKYIERISRDVPAKVDDVTKTYVRKLRRDLTYIIIAEKAHSWDEEIELRE